MKKIPLLFISALLLSATPLFAYEAPTDEAIDQLLANPKMINTLVEGANGAEAAQVLARIIAKISDSTLGSAQRNYLIAYYVSSAVALLPDTEMNIFARDLVAAVPRHLVPIVLSGLVVGGGTSESLIAQLMEIAENNASWTRAVQTPNITLTNPVYNLLVSNLSTSQSLPPAVINALPPPVPTGDGTSPSATGTSQPPVAETYDGQG
ncbi:MAG: hypothetical protein WD708_12490 [Kiritimatiellia bacterium]